LRPPRDRVARAIKLLDLYGDEVFGAPPRT